ncbi:hypothetical protein F5Y19DRAFT_458360 [Xylariaceae sp. FL1651]|nr:hypothetical protein F5Y19DRAFT_458360 [Xylariaceae sp. FL1651]
MYNLILKHFTIEGGRLPHVISLEILDYPPRVVGVTVTDQPLRVAIRSLRLAQSCFPDVAPRASFHGPVDTT